MSDATTYTIDAHDRLIRVNAAWHDFALANDSPGLASDRVLGRTLWDCITAAEVRLIYRELCQRARHRGTPLTLPFRCDAPDRRRLMRLTIRPLSRSDQRGFLEFRAELDEEQPRHPVDVLYGQRTDGGLLRMCSWCKRVDLGQWLELEEAVAGRGIMLSPSLPRITHGMCPDCERSLSAELDGPAETYREA